MTRKEIQKLCRTPDWRWATSEGAELHTLLLGLLGTFREKIQWLEEAETLALRLQAAKNKTRKAENTDTKAETVKAKSRNL